MPRTNVTVNPTLTSGTNMGTAAGDVANGNEFDNDGDTILHVGNSGASAHNLTLATPRQIDGVAVAAVTVSIPGLTTKMFGPFNPVLYNQANNRVYINVDHAELLLRVLAI